MYIICIIGCLNKVVKEYCNDLKFFFGGGGGGGGVNFFLKCKKIENHEKCKKKYI